MKTVTLSVLGISFNKNSVSSYSMILSEVEGNRKLPIIIGESEAFAISIALEKRPTKRPLIYNIIARLQKEKLLNIKHVLISECTEEGLFYSKIILANALGENIYIDSRTSDAVAIALFSKIPILINETILNQSGIILENSEERIIDNKHEKNELESMSKFELKNLIKQAIKEENYTLASQIKKLLDKS